MAYNAKQLSRQGGAGYAAGNVKSKWMYASADTLAAILASGYFNNGTNRLNQGDVIEVVAGVGGTLEVGTIQVTSAKAAATVTTALKSSVQAVTSGIKVARGVAAVTGSATVVTGLATVVAVVASMAADASLTNGNAVSATIGDQAGTPAAGSVILKVWKPTANNDTTPAASAAAVNVNWIAIGT